MSKEDTFVSLICICRNHGLFLPNFIAEATQYLSYFYLNYEIIIIDNGSTDNSKAILEDTIKKFASIRYLQLTRSTDFETAVMAGLDSSIGDYVVTINPDNDPINKIRTMIETCRIGNDLVIGQKTNNPKKNWFYIFLKFLFNSTCKFFFGASVAEGVTSFRAISRHGVNALAKIRSRRRYFPLVISEIGLSYFFVPYEQISRSGNIPNLNIFSVVFAGFSVLIHNSIIPLRIAVLLGITGSLVSLTYSLYVACVYITKRDIAPGWTTLSLALSVLFSISFIILALLGEYLGRLLEESGERPLYHLRDEISSSIMLENRDMKNVTEKH